MDDIAKIEKLAQDNKLVVVQSDPARRMVLLSGRVEDLSKAFDVKLEHYAPPNGTCADLMEAHTKPLLIDADAGASPVRERPKREALGRPKAAVGSVAVTLFADTYDRAMKIAAGIGGCRSH